MPLAAGTLLSCLIGAILRVPLGKVLWVCGPLAVAVSSAAMQLTNTLHPPGESWPCPPFDVPMVIIIDYV